MPGEFLKGFSKFFTNLSISQRQELDRIFSDLQNSKELTSLDESLRLLKRKVDQRLPIPELTVTATVRGAIIEWGALPDQRIIFYEIDISTVSNFASFDTVTTFSTQIIIDGLSQTKFVRVRGVRRDGTTTPYSDQTTVAPTLFDIQSHVAEAFYVNITGIEEQTIVGGPGTNLAYTPINPSGNSMVWGFITGYGDPVCAMIGDQPIEVRVMVKTTTASGAVTDVEQQRLSFGEFFNSLSIGPFIVAHPDLDGTIEVRVLMSDISVTEDGTGRIQDSTMVNWCHINILEIGSTGV